MKRSLLKTAAMAVLAVSFSASMLTSIEAASSSIHQKSTSPSGTHGAAAKVRKPHGLATIICGANPRAGKCTCPGGRRISDGTCWGQTCFVDHGVTIDCADLNGGGGKL
jgi:invasion protein IalB